MILFSFAIVLLSCYVGVNMEDDDKVRYFLVLGILLLIIFLPRILTGQL